VFLGNGGGAVEVIHGSHDTVYQPAFDGCYSLSYDTVDGSFLIFCEGLENIVRRIHPLWGAVYAHSQAGERLGGKSVYNGTHSSMSTCATFCTQAKATQGQIQVIVYHEDLFGRDAIDTAQAAHGIAAEIHEGLWLGENHAMTADDTFSQACLGLAL
jgi:hypothetical protein